MAVVLHLFCLCCLPVHYGISGKCYYASSNQVYVASAIQRNVEVYHGMRIPLESKWQLMIGRLTRGSYKAKFSITALTVKTNSNEISLQKLFWSQEHPSKSHILGELGALYYVSLNLRLSTTSIAAYSVERANKDRMKLCLR